MPEEEEGLENAAADEPLDEDALEPDYIEALEESPGLLPGFGFFIGILIGLYGLWFILANNEPIEVALFPLVSDVRTTVPVIVVLTAVLVLAAAGLISWRRRRRASAVLQGEADEE